MRPNVIARAIAVAGLLGTVVIVGGATGAAAAPAAAAPATGGHVYTIDKNHSIVGFSIRHLVSNVEGRFKDFAGTVAYDPKNPQASSVDVIVQATSIDTGTDRRDDDLRSENFFDVAKYPTLTFKSSSVAGSGNTLQVAGDLTIHGVTKRVTLPVKVLATMPFRNGEKAGFSTSFTVDRKDYGVTWNKALDQGGTLLGDEVTIDIQLETGWEPPKPAEAPAPAPSATPNPSGR